MKTTSFLMKLCLVFFALAVAFAVAGWLDWKYWNVMFNALGYAKTNFSALGVEMQHLKIPLNLTMYVVPTTLGMIAAGLAASSFLCLLLDTLNDVWSHFQVRQLRRKEQRNA